MDTQGVCVWGGGGVDEKANVLTPLLHNYLTPIPL